MVLPVQRGGPDRPTLPVFPATQMRRKHPDLSPSLEVMQGGLYTRPEAELLRTTLAFPQGLRLSGLPRKARTFKQWQCLRVRHNLELHLEAIILALQPIDRPGAHV